MNPKISIIVPFYNVEEYFDVFLGSLLPLNEDYEVILVNDGSPDNSKKIASFYAGKYTNVNVVDKLNGGLSSARNYGFNLIKGDYVIFFDSDDYIENKEVINEMLLRAVSTNSDIVVAPYYEFSNLSEKKYRYDKINIMPELNTLDEKLNPFFKNNLSFAVWNKLYNVDFLKKNNLFFKEGIWFEDLEFVFRAFCVAKKISKIDDILLGYRQREESIMKTISPKIIDKIIVLEELIEYLKVKYPDNNTVLEKFDILYLRMFFSVIYTIVKNDAPIELKEKLINELFSFNNFHLIIKGELKYKKWLSKQEKVFYYLLKYHILSKNNILKIQFLTKLRK